MIGTYSTVNAQQMFTWGKSFEVVDLEKETTAKVKLDYHISIDINNKLVVIEYSKGDYSVNEISKITNYGKQRIIKLEFKEKNTVLALTDEGIYMQDPNDPELVYFFKITSKNFYSRD